jgi:transposase InsO family protein
VVPPLPTASSGQTRLEATIAATMYWKTLRSMVRRHVQRCHKCQLGKRKKRKHGKLPTKIAETTPWRCVCVDLIGPYTIKAKDGTILDFMCLTMIDPATAWFEIIELPIASVKVLRKGEEVSEIIIDKSSAQTSRLFNKQWVSRYPRPKMVIYDNGSEFKLYFEELCETYKIKRKPTSVKNPQANAIIERMHAVLGDMLRTSNLDMADTVTPEDVDNFLTDAAWAIRSTYHTVLKSTPGAAIFGRDMLFDIPFLADWTAVGKRRQDLVDQSAAKENAKRVDFDYAVGQKVILRKDGVLRKAEQKYEGPFTITQVHTNGTVRIQRGSLSERLSIRRIEPYHEVV